MSIKSIIPNGPPGLVAKPNKNGAFRVYFQAPKDCPAGFPRTTPLPFENRTGRLDPEELAAIANDGWAVHRELERARLARDAENDIVTWDTLMERWAASSRFKRLKLHTRNMHLYWARRVARVFDTSPRLSPQRLTSSAADQALQEHFTANNAARCQTALNGMLAIAAADGLRSPLQLRLGMRLRKMVARPVWEMSDLEEYVTALVADNELALAGLIITAMDLAQRVGDVAAFRMGDHVTNDGWFRYHQSKTDAWVSFPAPPRVQSVLHHLNTPHGKLIFPNPTCGEAFTARCLTGRFAQRRKKYLKSGQVSRHLTLQTLRHSGVVELARAGCSTPEIGSLTGHSYKYIEELMETYLRRDSICAVNAINRREAWRQQMQRSGEKPHIKMLGDQPVFILPASDAQRTIH